MAATATLPFVQARNFTKGRSGSIDLVVIHTMEAPEKPTTAENVAAWFAGSSAPKASAHYCIDSDTVVQCVKDTDIAWHAPGANHDGIGIEHAGRAAQTAKDWSDAYSKAMLERSAQLTASLCKRYDIPVTWLRPADLLAGRRGITGHVDVSRAFKKSDHHDPGTGFPIERYLALVRAHMGDSFIAPHVHPGNQKTPPPTLKQGDKGFQVKRLQLLLKRRGFDPGAADGVFGAGTKKAVGNAQAMYGLNTDGIAGPMTWSALAAG